jgi:hypothetical protein
MNDDFLCNRFTNGMANVTLRTHAMSHRAKSVTPLAIAELQNLIDSPHLGRTYRTQDDNDGNDSGRCNGKRQRNNGGNGDGDGHKKLRHDKHEADPKDKTRGKRKGKGKMRRNKCFFGQQEMEYLRYIFPGGKLSVSTNNVEAVKE